MTNVCLCVYLWIYVDVFYYPCFGKEIITFTLSFLVLLYTIKFSSESNQLSFSYIYLLLI